MLAEFIALRRCSLPSDRLSQLANSELTLQGVPGVGGQTGLAVVPDEGPRDGVVDPVRDDPHVDDEYDTNGACHS